MAQPRVRSSRRSSEPEDMEQRTPGTPTINPMAGTPAHTLRSPAGDRPTRGSSAARGGIRHVLCEGRKRRSGRTQANVGEHIDIIVPDPADNARAVEEFLDPIGQLGITDEQRDQLLAGYNENTIHIAGQHYHFVGGEVTDVLAEHVPWLENHPAYAFRAVSTRDL